MSKGRRTSSRGPGPRFVAALLLAVSTAGCLSWHVVERPPREHLVETRPGKVRITKDDGTRQVIIGPRSLGDVLAGFDEECISEFGRASNQCPEIGVPFFEVSQMEVEQRGFALIYLPAVAGLLAVWLLLNR